MRRGNIAITNKNAIAELCASCERSCKQTKAAMVVNCPKYIPAGRQMNLEHRDSKPGKK